MGKRILIGVACVMAVSFAVGAVMGRFRPHPERTWPEEGLQGVIDGCKRIPRLAPAARSNAVATCTCYGNHLSHHLTWSEFVAATRAQEANKPVAPSTYDAINSAAAQCLIVK
ncbi:MAG TPA: hypothetical protein VEP66_11605 [Myxococcales bacterium]|nr:hypothetical protein [Myxococcales bacterium]